MTFEELKAEAARQGYSLLKRQEPVKFTPCTCGKNRRNLWVGAHGMRYQCITCGFKGPTADTEYEAKLAWNKAIEEAMNNG